MKVAYIRTSTIEQTPELQIADIKTLLSTEPDLILQEQVSAFKNNLIRPMFEELKKLIRNRTVASVYVWHLDRIFRNRKKLVEFLSFCKNYQVQVFSYNQKWLNAIQEISPPFNEIMYDLMLQIIGFMAEDESQTKSKRVKMAVRRTSAGTVSYKGNRWGRKGLTKQTLEKVITLFQSGISIRNIASAVKIYDSNNNARNISKSAVHKIIAEFKAENHS